MFRAGHDDAFRVIHDRYRQRLFAYTRQMLPHRQDAEDALQDVFVRAYAGLRADRRELALRAWLYRVAHNRCIDELRRPAPPRPEVMQLLRAPVHDPIAEADQRESLRRLIADVRRLPDQQRSALLMRELGGMSYADIAAALGVTVPAVKSLLVRARLALAQALEARDTACSDIREELIVAHDRGLRPNATARRHMRDCAGCREFRHQLRGVSRRFAAIVPTLGPLGVLANVLGVGGAGGGAAGGALAAGGVAGTSTAVVSVGTLSAGAGHVATVLAAAVVTAGGAVELQHTLPATPPHHHVARAAAIAPARHAAPQSASASSADADVTSSSNSSEVAPATSVSVIIPARPTAPLIRHGSSATSADQRDRYLHFRAGDLLEHHDDRLDQGQAALERRHLHRDQRRRRESQRAAGRRHVYARKGNGVVSDGHVGYIELDVALDEHILHGVDRGAERLDVDHAAELHQLESADFVGHDRRQLAGQLDRDRITDGPHDRRGPDTPTVRVGGTRFPAPAAETTDTYLETLDHEDVVVRRGERSGFYTFVAVHSTIRGPSLGGCRMWGYADARRGAARCAAALARDDVQVGGGGPAPRRRQGRDHDHAWRHATCASCAAPRCSTSPTRWSRSAAATSPPRTSAPRAATCG